MKAFCRKLSRLRYCVCRIVFKIRCSFAQTNALIMLGMQKPNWFKINEPGAICDADNILNCQISKNCLFSWLYRGCRIGSDMTNFESSLPNSTSASTSYQNFSLNISWNQKLSIRKFLKKVVCHMCQNCLLELWFVKMFHQSK